MGLRVPMPLEISQKVEDMGEHMHTKILLLICNWISPEFKLYLIKEFQRLKEEELQREKLGWDVKREIAKINYTIHTDAIKEHLIDNKSKTDGEKI